MPHEVRLLASVVPMDAVLPLQENLPRDVLQRQPLYLAIPVVRVRFPLPLLFTLLANGPCSACIVSLCGGLSLFHDVEVLPRVREEIGGVLSGLGQRLQVDGAQGGVGAVLRITMAGHKCW